MHHSKTAQPGYRSIYPQIGVGLFLLFLFFSFLVHKNIFTATDFDITVRLQDHMPRRFDQLFSLFSLFGRFETMSVVLAIILLIRHKLSGLLVLGAYGFIHLFELYGKYFVNHKPPPHFLLRTEYPVNFPQFYVSTQNSYPSGHAGRSVFISLLIVFLLKDSKKLNKQAKYIIYAGLFVYDFVMLVSRPYLGEHWTSDVIGGCLIGASMGFLVKRYV